jgi:hypothetical protein
MAERRDGFAFGLSGRFGFVGHKSDEIQPRMDANEREFQLTKKSQKGVSCVASTRAHSWVVFIPDSPPLRYIHGQFSFLIRVH